MKIPAVAHPEQEAGAIGITCAKLSEAEVMAAAGIRAILVANEVIGSQKITRLVNLSRQADVIGRCGVEPGTPAVRLSQKVAALPSLRYAGLMGWEGHLASKPPSDEKRQGCEEAVTRLVESAEACRAAGLEVSILRRHDCLSARRADRSARWPGRGGLAHSWARW